MLRAALPPTHVAARSGAADRRHPGARPAHGDQHLAHRRAPPGGAGCLKTPPAPPPPPGERKNKERGRRHKALTDGAGQRVLQARRWMPERTLVLVADSSFAALELLAGLVRQGVTCVTRLRLDAALYAPAPPRQPRTRGRPRSKGA